MKASNVWHMPRPSLQQPVQQKDLARQDWAPHLCVRLMMMALVAWAVVWGTPPSASAQEDPSRSSSVALVWQGKQYLCGLVEPQSAEGEPYFCAPGEPQNPEGSPYLCAPVALQNSHAALNSSPGKAAPAMMARTCWIDDNGIRSCCQGSWCCSYIDGQWWCG
jgi:hypothetical protein